MLEILENLCNLCGPSGREDKIRDYIIGELQGKEYSVDNMGNLLVFSKGRKKALNKLMVCAHMDEVGFIATYITEEGLIKFAPVGGIMPAAAGGKSVVFENGTVGVIGIKPVHLCDTDEKTEYVPLDRLYIDIGEKTAADTLKRIKPGDTAVFNSPYVDMGDKILSKAIDDRLGCSVMLDMIKSGTEYDTWFVFTVQEEVGLRGAGCAAFALRPDYCLVLEATTASDIPGVPSDKKVCFQNKGAVLSFMDNGTLYDKEMYDKILSIAEENNIAVQSKTAVAGGNDAGIIHKTAGGIRTAAISLPCRYIHSSSSVCSKADAFAVRSLAQKAAEYFASHE